MGYMKCMFCVKNDHSKCISTKVVTDYSEERPSPRVYCCCLKGIPDAFRR
jgi:hypothetical protein